MLRKKNFIFILFAIIFLMFPLLCGAEELEKIIPDISDFEMKENYSSYLERYREAPRPEIEIIVPAEKFSETNMDIEILSDYQGVSGKAIKTAEKGYVEWKVEVPEAGLYNLALKYYPVEGRSADIERSLRINGEIPFLEAAYISFQRVWQDKGEILRDNRGNEIAPTQVESPIWLEKSICDEQGYYNDPFLFYFEQGENTITIESQREPMVIAYLKIYQQPELPFYQEVVDAYQARGYQKTNDVMIKVQAENTKYKSSPIIYPIFDRGSANVEPYHPAQIRLNALGGQRWQIPGEWVIWEFEVPEDGLYKIAFKAMQNVYHGSYTNREISIDGQVPFQELKAVRFKFSNEYQMRVLGDDEENPYLFYLEKGKHTLQMKVVLGELASLLRQVEGCLYELNNIFRQIVMITSSAPDTLRDYQLEKRIPDVITNLENQADEIKEVATTLEEYTGQRGGHVALLNDVSRQFKRMAEDPRIIPRSISAFRDYLASLGNWILDTRNQPLQLDYLIIASPDQLLPRAESTTLEKLSHELKAFVYSFIIDYDLIGDIHDKSEGKEPITVWVASGRDQAQVLKNMIEDTFTPQTGIYINLELVDPNVILPATLAGEGPDIVIDVETSVPMDFALRNAVVDLTQFEDFEEVAKRFHRSALVSYTFRNKVYALPTQQIFNMLFYRKDILSELGLNIPRTWEDVMEVIPELQKRNMNFGLPLSALAIRRASGQRSTGALGSAATGAGSLTMHPGVMPFLAFLYQKGGDLYLPDGVKTALDSEVAVESFQLWTDLYVLYDLPVEYDQQNRFRTGEIPLLIAHYNLYNSIQVFAPEIRGRWGFTLVPGTAREDGSIDRTIPNGAARAIMILKDAQSKEDCWEFLKWFTSADIQYRYGRELEILMGVAARHPTANMEAASRLPWSIEEFNTLEAQWQLVRGIPEVPGAYMTGRHLDNAHRKVVLENKKVRKTLQTYVRKIDFEIEIKREEFGLETDVEEVLKKYGDDVSWDYFD